MDNMKIVILGPQGSGKGTQAELISKEYDLMHIDMGSSLRERQKTVDELGLLIRETISKGDLLPDDIPFRIISEKIKDYNKGFLVDGFPRNVEQLKLAEQITQFNVAIYVKISDEEAVRRIEKRRVCEKCGKTYIYQEGMKLECGCGGKIVQRTDDTPEAIKKRLSLYHAQTELLIREYTDRNILLEINGGQMIEAVFDEIKLKLKQKLNEIKIQSE